MPRVASAAFANPPNAAERDWYRGEALRLDSFCTSLKADVEYMRDKLAALEDDRAWLERQLKSAKRNDALAATAATLAAASHDADGPTRVGTAGPATTGAWDGGDDGDGMGGGESTHHLPVVPTAAPRTTAAASAGRGSGRGPALNKTWGLGGARGPAPGAPIAHSAMPGAAVVPAAATVDEAVHRAAIASLQQQLDASTRMMETLRTRNARLKAANDALRGSRGELESFFLQCIEDVRKEIARRRVRSLTSTTAATSTALPGLTEGAGRRVGAGGAGGTELAEAALDSSQAVELAVTLARAKNVSLADFSAADRRAVVSRLLQDNLVLGALHRVIFEPGEGMGPGASYDAGGGTTEEAGEGAVPAVPLHDDAAAGDGGMGAASMTARSRHGGMGASSSGSAMEGLAATASPMPITGRGATTGAAAGRGPPGR